MKFLKNILTIMIMGIAMEAWGINNPPIILIVPEYEIHNERNGKTPSYYEVRDAYASLISQAGGIPVIVILEEQHIEEYLNMADGLLMIGGPDIERSFYTANDTKEIIGKRTNFESTILKKAIEKQMPFLGICRGLQLMNVALGGTLIEDIPPTSVLHRSPTKGLTNHKINIEPNTILASIVKEETITVNSGHHQAIQVLGNNLRINAKAEDGIIEGIEHTNHPFCIAVQGHPEYQHNPQDMVITQAFMAASKLYKESKLH